MATYGAIIRWTQWNGVRTERSMTGASSWEEAWRAVLAMERRRGWTQPRWYQWWRWHDTRVPEEILAKEGNAHDMET